jgi:hypothetical protein
MGKRTTSRRARRGSGKRGKSWETYEQVAQYVLQQLACRFGLSIVEGKQSVRGQVSGTRWVLDAKGIREDDGAIVIIECRRYMTSRLSQEKVGAIALRVQDTGAAGAITVSPYPLQKGAEKVAKAYRIEHVQLQPESTYDQWVAQIGTVIHVGLTDCVSLGITETLQITVRDANGNVIEQQCY